MLNSALTAMRRFLPLIVLLPLLAACAAAAPLAVIESGPLIGTDKTLSDHAVSLASGKNCSTLRVNRGQYYCEEDEPQLNHSQLYCYKTLGGVACYDREDPRYERVNRNDQNRLERSPR